MMGSEIKKTEDSTIKAIRNHLEDKYEELIEEEVERATNRIRERIRNEQDRIVLSMLEHYNVERRGPSLRITVDHFYEKPE